MGIGVEVPVVTGDSLFDRFWRFFAFSLMKPIESPGGARDSVAMAEGAMFGAQRERLGNMAGCGVDGSVESESESESGTLIYPLNAKTRAERVVRNDVI